MRGLEVTCRSFAGSTGADLSIIKPIKPIKFKGGDMTSNIFQDIKDRVDLKDLVRFYGLDVNRGGFACCPFHNERNPSFKVYENHYHCFGCGEHGDHVDFVQKLYGLTNIEAAKKISHDLGLGLDNGELAIPVKPKIFKPKKDEAFELWLKETTQVVIEYKKLLDYWRKVYDPRSPIDKVDDRFVESLHQRDYVEYYLDKLLFGSKEEKYALYDSDRDYPLSIKNRLDSLDTVSRKAYRKVI